jgi:FKBP-type peptidyl-prolyl cis-trans isomerase FklB
MSSKWIPVLAITLLAGCAGAQVPSAPATDLGRRSYAVGVDLAKNLQKQGITFDYEALVAGLHDVFAKDTLRMSDQELSASLTALQNEIKLLRARPLQMVADRNRSEGAKFLEGNKDAKGVVTLPSGVQYLVLAEGHGPRPGDADTAVCNYKGLLLDGTEFDSTYRRGQAADLALERIVPGLRDALLKMPAGSTWRIWIPYQQGYGEKGAPPTIQPCATLAFDLVLLQVKGPDAKAKAS